ncbi:transmembrane and coiled-coil domain-containing protein 4-like [Haliotis rufescens]|uniref:transmembrane and coiled-coil domain-containing protein 4-like n=1 Tax=Haliotis rufescens TaxID=6454 RepID=UPI00201F3EF6|nr:transmembrane and coiled-coil domain-containing protein 4-like [Haliotis rufescens]
MADGDDVDDILSSKQKVLTDGSDVQRKHEPPSANSFTPSKPIHKLLSDVGQYSYAALCAVSLRLLFGDSWHRNFKEDTLNAILKHLDQPSQVCESIQALLAGQGVEETNPYVDLLFEEEVLNNNGDPIVTDLVTMAITKGCYDSRMRVFVKHAAWQLRVSWDILEDIECQLAETLGSNQYVRTDEEIKEKKREATKSKVKRIALISLATIGGGTLIGLTGGLAAPLVAAGAGALIGGAGAAALGTTAGVAIIGSLFGVAGAGLTGYKMKRRVGAIEEFEFEPLIPGAQLHMESVTKQLHITVAVTGWLSSTMQDFRQPWKSLAESREQYCLRWESRYLIELGKAFDYILSGAVTMATQEALKYTILSGLLAAIAWPTALLSAASMIDNPWSVAVQRANSSGKQLAEVLLAREQGKRPVTLIGFSLGARVIFTCLEELCKRKGCEGIVEDVILLGAPVSGDSKYWKPLERVIAGKIINGYCRGDWLLKFLYRTASVQMKIAGLGPIKWNNRRMHNIDLSDVVNGHSDYMKQLDVIMKVVGVRTKDELKKSSTKSSFNGSLSPGDTPMSDQPSQSTSLSTSPSLTASPSCAGSVEMQEISSPHAEGEMSDQAVDDNTSDSQSQLDTLGNSGKPSRQSHDIDRKETLHNDGAKPAYNQNQNAGMPSQSCRSDWQEMLQDCRHSPSFEITSSSFLETKESITENEVPGTASPDDKPGSREDMNGVQKGGDDQRETDEEGSLRSVTDRYETGRSQFLVDGSESQVLKSSLETDGVERVTSGLGDVHVVPHTANDV